MKTTMQDFASRYWNDNAKITGIKAACTRTHKDTFPCSMWVRILLDIESGHLVTEAVNSPGNYLLPASATCFHVFTTDHPMSMNEIMREVSERLLRA